MSIIEFNSIDSTNNYAMQLIDADKAQPGLTITAQSQTGGKGQRGRSWTGLLMSVITNPTQAIRAQFAFNALVAVTIANVLQKSGISRELYIKWPNDIIINDKKAGGILIENVLRGSRWTHSVIGLGLNVKQEAFPEELPYATSLKIATGKDIDMTKLRDDLSREIFHCSTAQVAPDVVMKEYNNRLYKRGRKQRFSNADGSWEAAILGAHDDGTLEVQLEDGSMVRYYHGQVVWEWGS
jgi:BirA family biotin operon repressor/biotin-[acetyl-CoA-carboxylase] ligase